MAENLDTPSFGSFSIENTMEMGAGSAELLNDLMSPETSTGNPDDIQEIVKEVEDAPAPAPKKAPAGKTIGETVADVKAPEKEEKEDASATLAKFLTGDDEEEEDNEESPAPKAKAKAPVETKQEEEDEDEPVVSRFTALSNDLFKLGVFTNIP